MAQWVKILRDISLGSIGEYGDGRRVEQPITVAGGLFSHPMANG
jgi:hypothetical protein